MCLIIKIPSDIIVEVDNVRFQQVFSNIFSNAVKNTPMYGGIECNAFEKDGGVQITIEDNGVGFTEDEKKKLFTMFGKIERYGQDLDIISDGTGLGLYISKQIINRHGGTITVESEGRNRGASVKITIPKSRSMN